jgi:hypothetical protein
MTDSSFDAAAFQNFEDASQAVLAYLRGRFGFGPWMTTRTVEPDWIVLNANGQHHGVEPGTVFQWADSFCSRMVRGEGPCIASDVREVPAYLAAPIGEQVEIGAYIGVPISIRAADRAMYEDKRQRQVDGRR